MCLEIHHLAAVSGDMQKTIAFYHHLLGLKFIRKASLFDGPMVCHFYWGEQISSFITFYHCPGLDKNKAALSGAGAISFSVSKEATGFWVQRLKQNNIQFAVYWDEIEQSEIFVFHDPDGLRIKLIFTSEQKAHVSGNRFINYAIWGIYGIEIVSKNISDLAKLFVGQFRLDVRERSANHYRFHSDIKQGSVIDVGPGTGAITSLSGCGRIHHVAFMIKKWEHYTHLQNYFEQLHQNTIYKKHPNNYSALYFWNDGDMLFEIVAQKPCASKDGFVRLKQHIPDLSMKSHVS